MPDSERIQQLRQKIQEEEKRFLMDRYVKMLMAQVEETGEEELDDRTVESLLVSRSYVSDDLATHVGDLLENAGYEVEDMEREDDEDDAGDDAQTVAANGAGNGHTNGLEAAEDFDTAVEDEDFAALLDGEDVSETEGPPDADTAGEDLFGDGDSSDDPALHGTEVAVAEDGPPNVDAPDGDALDSDDRDIGDPDLIDAGDADATGLFDEEDPAGAATSDAGPDPDLAAPSAPSDVAEDDPAMDPATDAEAVLDGEGLFDDGHEAAAADPIEEASDAADSDGEQEITEIEDVGLFDDEDGASPSDAPRRKARKASTDEEGETSAADREEDEGAGVLFDQDIYSGNEGASEIERATDGDDAAQDLEETAGFTPTEGHAIEETPGFTATQGHDIEETPGFTATQGHDIEETPGFTPTQGHDIEETPGFTPTEGHDIEETPGFTPTEGHDIEETPGFTPAEGHDIEETPGFTPTQGHDIEETPGFTPAEGHEIEETPGFTPTQGHEIEETPGFTPVDGAELDGADETPGFTPTTGHDVEETPGFTPTKGPRTSGVSTGFTPVDDGDLKETPGFAPVENDETDEGATPGFEAIKGHDVEETPGFTATKGHDTRRKKAGSGFTVDGEVEAESTVGNRPSAADLNDAAEEDPKKRPAGEQGEAEEEEDKTGRRFATSEERAERLKKAQEERRARLLKQQPQAAKAEEEEEATAELDLESLTHQISLDDIEQYLGMSVLPDDRQKLDRRWQQKIRDPSIRALLASETAMEHPYALVPRLPRFFKGGAAVQANMLNLVRNYPQLFDNVAGLINKYRTEEFFVGETPELDWAIVACEALPDSLNRNYMEQKTVVKQYAQQHQTNERRIQRRRLIEILYDCIVINAVTKEQILGKTVDLSDSRVGRQNFACVNYGEKGIRINDVSRQQRHPQMGICPSW